MDIRVDSQTVIVFDLDDTLYNELDFLKSAYQSIALFLEPSDWKSLYSKMFSLYRCKVNVFEFLADAYRIEIKILLDMYRNHHPNIHLFEGVIELFDSIKSRDGKIGIITDGRSKTQRAKLKSLGITQYLDCIIISEEIGSEKPSIANFKAIENSVGGKNFYYIADNIKKDFIAPNALGWKSIALIDNGKNIHFQSHMHMYSENTPHGFILNLKDLTII